MVEVYQFNTELVEAKRILNKEILETKKELKKIPQKTGSYLSVSNMYKIRLRTIFHISQKINS